MTGNYWERDREWAREMTSGRTVLTVHQTSVWCGTLMLLAELGDPPLDLLLFKEQNEEKYFGIFAMYGFCVV